MKIPDVNTLIHAVDRVHPGPRDAALLARLLLTAGTGGNLTTDAHLAALAIEHGATIGSLDRDFRQFAGIHLDWLAAD